MPLVKPSVELQVCAEKKDRFYADILKSHLTCVMNDVLGDALGLRYTKYIDFVGDFLYHAITTLTGLQTLGEEYISLIQVDSSRRKVPSFLRRFATVFLQTLFLPLMRREAKKRFPEDDVINQQWEPLVDAVHQLNAALFYVTGRHLSMSKRVTSVHYLRLSATTSEEGVGGDETFDLIGRLMLVRWALNSWRKCQQIVEERKAEANDTNTVKLTASTTTQDKIDEPTCSLCLSAFQQVSVTKCGHLFCWNCIQQWLAKSNQWCPVCRDILTPRDIVPLQNF